MTKRLRILSERQLEAIGKNGLHAILCEELKDEVAAALDAVAAGLTTNTVYLDQIVDLLAGMLLQQEGIKEKIREVSSLGGTGLNESELCEAVAVWIVDNQLGGGFDWDPRRRPEAS
jgi:hypothetical protein